MPMTDEQKQEERRQKEKEAVASMRLAVGNMQAALTRIHELQEGLKTAANEISTLKRYVSDKVYDYGGKNKVVDRFDAVEAACRKLL